MKILTAFLFTFLIAISSAFGISQTAKQKQISVALKLAGSIGGQQAVLIAEFNRVKVYDTSVELLAATPDDGTLGYALDTDIIYVMVASSWVGIAGGSGLTGTNGGTIDNETNNAWTLGENSETLTFTFGTDDVAVTSASGVTELDLGTINLETDEIDANGTGTLTILVNGESTVLTATTDVVTFSSGTSATFTFTPVVTFTGGITSTAGVNTINDIAPSATVMDFTYEHQVPFFAKTTGAIMTEADTQEDYFRVGPLNTYFEIFQDGNNTDCVGSWGDGAAGWVIPGPNAADQGLQLTEGIVLGSAHSFTAQTDTATMTVVFKVATRAQLDVLQVGFRVLAAYAVGDDDTEWAAAYDDKATVGIIDNAGVIKQTTSVATSDVTTACTHAAAADGDLLALRVAVSAAGATTVSVGTDTPAGGTTAQIQTSLTAALADLTADTLCNAAAVTLTAGEYVPTIAMAKAAGGVSTLTLIYYYYE
jgi:hypothetical protein